MNEFVAADQIAGLQRIIVAFDATDDAAGFAHDDLAGRDIPGLQIALPKAVETARRDEGQIQRSGAEPAQARYLVLDFRHLQTRKIEIAAADMRQSAADHAVAK